MGSVLIITGGEGPNTAPPYEYDEIIRTLMKQLDIAVTNLESEQTEMLIQKIREILV